MNWIIITLIAVLFWAVSNIIDKTIVSKYFKKPVIYIFFLGIFSAIPLLAIPYTGLSIVSGWQVILALLAGALYLYGLIPYIYALFDEEVSRVIPIWQITPVFVLALSYLFIGESLTKMHLIAFALILFGSILISVKRTKGLFKLNKAFYLMILSSAIFGIQYVLTKYVYLNQSYVNGFLWIKLGTVLAVIPLFFVAKYRKEFANIILNLKKRTQIVIACSEICGLTGVVLVNYAISLNSVSLISALEGVQPLFVLILAGILSKWQPKLLKEEIGKKTLLIKLIAIILIILGVYLVNI